MLQQHRLDGRDLGRRHGFVGVLTFALALLLALVASAADPAGAPRTHALLINGGQSPQDNMQSHLHHLQDMVAELRERGLAADRIHVFSSDGADPKEDLAVRDSEDSRLWLLGGTNLWHALNRVDVINTAWEGIDLKPAKLGDLRRFFVNMSRELAPGDTLFVFVTDHGTDNRADPGNGLISLWNESMSVLEFRALLAHLQPGVRVVDVMSQCYSGGFADAMMPFNASVPSGDVCGFYSTSADRPAYGCYPEGREHDRMGHAFGFIDAMKRHGRLSDAHVEVLATDKTPDVPLRTSDIYLDQVLDREATDRGIAMDALADELLSAAWQDRGRWEPEIRLLDRIGAVYRTFSPRSLAEFGTQLAGLKSLSRELGTYGGRWKLALDDLRKDNLERFLEANPGWVRRLDPDRLNNLADNVKKNLLDGLLPELDRFSRDRPDTWERLETLRARVRESRHAEFRVEIRVAALLRMRSVLLRIAALQLLDRAAPDAEPDAARPDLREARHALDLLVACEAATIGLDAGVSDATTEPLLPEPLPPFEEDLAVVDRVLPSWLGIRFQEVPPKQQEAHALQPGAVVVQQVYEGSAAARAGLEPGDFVLGPPGDTFVEPRQIREWIMGSPRDTPLPLAVLREGTPIEVTVALGPYPLETPRLPEPPDTGDAAPPLAGVEVIKSALGDRLALKGKGHLLFFWATWCGPCKQAIPELLAWSAQAGTPIVALTDEAGANVTAFLDSWSGPFPETVATDELRLNYVGYGVSGTPTFVLVGADGRVEWRQTGYSDGTGLEIGDWHWQEQE